MNNKYEKTGIDPANNGAEMATTEENVIRPFAEVLEQTQEQTTEAENTAQNQTLERIQNLEAELSKAKDMILRTAAEAENTRKRAQRDREDASKYAIANFARDLITVADNLRRALNAMPKDVAESNEQLKGLIHGIEATERELLNSFEKNGIRKIEPLNEIFNPNFHEVMFEAPPVPGMAAGTIIQILETGYLIHDRLLRPARVGVVKALDSQNGITDPGHNIDTQV